MNISSPFIKRPVATSLLTLAVALVGIVAFWLLPVSPLPQIDFATISVSARLPGASPETMAATVATPLERTLGRIAGISEMTSQSSLGTTSIVLQFDLDRDIDGAARDVQAAINAARGILPTMPDNPTYRKRNPADAPIMILGLTSPTLPVGSLYDIASSVLAQKVSQIYGVGQVQVSGSSLPAVRIELDPLPLQQTGLSLESLRTAIARANANLPKGMLDNGETQWLVAANDKLTTAEEFGKIIVRSTKNGTLRLSDMARVEEGEQDLRTLGFADGKQAILLIVYKQAGANIVDTVERIKEQLPLLRAWTPESVDFTVIMDRSPSITASLLDVEITLCIAMLLVMVVVFFFLRNLQAISIPAVAVPVSLLGTFGVMYLLGYSLNHLSLMAMTIATGFVVDDAIVVTENIVRHVENGVPPLEAAHRGSREVAFTVISISISLVAIFIPILGMGGLLGRLFKEFAVTLSTAVLVSLVISLVTTPMMCSRILQPDMHKKNRWRKRRKSFDGSSLGAMLSSSASIFGNAVRRSVHITRLGISKVLDWWFDFLDSLHERYATSLAKVLRHKRLTLLILIATMGLNVYLYVIVPKGFFPKQDTGLLFGLIQADQSVSFQAMRPKVLGLADIVRKHPSVASVGGFAGGMQQNSGVMFVSLKPRSEREETAEDVINQLRRKLNQFPAANLYLQPMQDLFVGGRRSSGAVQYTLQSDDLADLREWTPKVLEAIKGVEGLLDVNSDQENRGLQTTVMVDRNKLAALGITQKQVDSALGLAFGQSYASTIYSGNNQYRVVMEFDRPYLESPDQLDMLYVPTGGLTATASPSLTGTGTGLSGNVASTLGSAQTDTQLVPLATLAAYEPNLTALSVSHQGQSTATTISFNMEPGVALSAVQERIKEAVFQLGMPSTVRGGFQGTAKVFTDSVKNQPMLLFAAVVTLYIVLGVLYESLIHPLTILSTLPSAGIGAILGLMLFGEEFTVIAFIGVLLLAGIVKKNAIMMIDFAIAARRQEGLDATAAIYQACLLRFRPIMMTTMAAIFGAIPLVISFGEGSEMRAPLGITIVGGLMVSQLLTLYTTPVVYLYLDRFTKEAKNGRKSPAGQTMPERGSGSAQSVLTPPAEA